jgi:hypothetical protein
MPTRKAMMHKRLLNAQDYKTLSLSAFGGALEFYDFIIFVFFSKVIGGLFFPADMPEFFLSAIFMVVFESTGHIVT